MVEKHPSIMVPRHKPWWRRHKSFFAPGPGGRPVLWAKELTIAAPAHPAPALTGINLSFRAGTLTAVLDRDLARARLLLLALSGLVDASCGQVEMLRSAATEQGRAAARTFISTAAQVDPTLTVRQNLILALSQSGIVIDSDHFQRVVEVCELDDYLDSLPDAVAPFGDLRVAAARALVCGVQALLLHAPLEGLRPFQALHLMEFLRAISSLGCAVAFSCLDPHIAGQADRAIVIVDGHVRADIAYPDAPSIEQMWVPDENPVPMLGPAPTAQPTVVSPSLTVDQTFTAAATTALAASAPAGTPAQPTPAPAVDEQETVGRLANEQQMRATGPGAAQANAAPAASGPTPETTDEVLARAREILDALPGPVIDVD